MSSRQLALFLAVAAGAANAQQMIGDCPVLPANNIWNSPVDTLPVLSNSTTLVNTIGATTGLHADFGAGLWDGGPIGIPFITVPGTQTKYPATFLYWDESDPGPYAVPLNAPIEGGSTSNGDRHAIAIDTDACILYELYRAFPQSASWQADSGAIFNLNSNALRPETWTSADAAGLPIMPGLVNYDEVMSGEIRHAIRFTAPQTRRAYVWPARHYASSLTGTQYPRMGERFRLKAGFNISTFPPEVQTILRAMKKYGIILADNGSAWFISGRPDERWNNDNLRTLSQVKGQDFEAVDATVLMISPNSGEATQNGVTVTFSPTSASVRAGRTRQFTATVTGTPNTAVTWSATAGAIDSSGLYLAPSTVPNPPTDTVRATSLDAPASSGTAAVTILPTPSISSVSPSPVIVGSFTLTVNGAGFDVGSAVSWGGAPLATTYVSAAQLTATGNAASAASNVPVVVNTADGAVSNTVYVNVVPPPPITVTISPTSTSVRINRTRQFTATVTGTTNTAVIWKVNGIPGGNSTAGTINTSGQYRAPGSAPTPPGVTVSATVQVDQTKVANAAVTITRK